MMVSTMIKNESPTLISDSWFASMPRKNVCVTLGSDMSMKGSDNEGLIRSDMLVNAIVYKPSVAYLMPIVLYLNSSGKSL